MNKTLRISFSLKNTYRVNTILYSLKQIPLLKKVIPDSLYQIKGLKIFANIVAGIWEVLSAFLGKFLYFLVCLVLAASFYNQPMDKSALFLHILIFMTVIGAFVNTYMFNPTKDKYYAMVLMRMDAKEFTLIQYAYEMLKVFLGFLAFSLLFGMGAGVPVWVCILIPFFVMSLKISVAAFSIGRYEKTGVAPNENQLGKFQWIAILVLLLAAYAPPIEGAVLPEMVSVILMILPIPFGILSISKIVRFQDYYLIYRQILSGTLNQTEAMNQMRQEKGKNMISIDGEITSKKKGFEYLNELFIKRHQKILWKAAKRTALVSLGIIAVVLLLISQQPQIKEKMNGVLLTYLPYFVYIMYAINKGTGFTSALFMNCDHCLLTYPFYKRSDYILKLFQIRLREIIKVNLLPALTIGGGLVVLLYITGGTDNPLNYGITFVSILCMSILFSIHYLTIYYLLQPFNANTEIKSGTYKIVCTITYLICFFMINFKISTLVFGIALIIFCILYSIVACILVYKFAPKTFRLRN